MASRGRGRRPGDSGTREAVLDAARRSFATVGYAATTIRRVAADAEVDPSLVMQFHGSKAGLFRDAMALPLDTAAAIAAIAEGPRRRVGERLLGWLADAWEDPLVETIFLGRLRTAATEPEGAALVRAQVADDVVVPLLRTLGSDRVELRAALVSTVLFGVIMTRSVVEVEGFAGLGLHDLSPYLAPTLQRYLVDPLPS